MALRKKNGNPLPLASKFIRKAAYEEDIDEGLLGRIDWDVFGHAIINEGIGPVVYQSIRGKASVPRHVISLAREHHENSLIFKDFCIQKLQGIKSDLVQEGRIVFIQGFALFERIYKEPLSRQMGDIDIFLPDGNLKAVSAVLEKNGFQKYLNYKNIWCFKGLHIDLHEDLWGCDRISQRRYIAPEEPVGFEPSRQVPGCYILSPPSLSLHSAFHSLKHGFSKLFWYFDLLRLYRFGYFNNIMKTDGQNIISIVINHLNNIGLIEQQEMPGYRPSSSLRRHLIKNALRLRSKQGSGEIALALACPDLRQTILYLAASAFPKKETLREMYGNRLFLLLILIRIWSLIKILVKSLL